MSSSTVYSTASGARCRAQNPLTCREHGLAGGFTEVPQFVADNVDRLRSLREQSADAKVALYEFAGELGLPVSRISYVTHGQSTTRLSQREVAILSELEEEAQEAAENEDEERDYQRAIAADYVREQVGDRFEAFQIQEQRALRQLAGGAFAGEEAEWGDPNSFEFLNHWGPAQAQMYSLLENPYVRRQLPEIDAGYFTALSGRIPTPEQLRELSRLRQVRNVRPPTAEEQIRTIELVTELSAID